MTSDRRGWLPAVAVALLLAVAGLAYRGEIGQMVGNAQAYPVPPTDTPTPDPYPNGYPPMYLPALLYLPEPTETPPPPRTLRLGLNVRWDGQGRVYFDGYTWWPGTHLTRRVDQQIDGDTVGVRADHWYSPNPFSWEDESWYCRYNTLSNHSEGCDTTDDPAWKWGFYWIMPAEVTFAAGRNVTIDDEVFTVSGPHSFELGNGETAYFWRLRNRDRFLMHADGGEWTQYVEAGDAELFYEVGSGLLLRSQVERTLYKNGNSTSNVVRYDQEVSSRGDVTMMAGDLAMTPAAPQATADELARVLEENGLDLGALRP